MLKLNKTEISKDFSNDHKNYASVCNSCACGGGVGTCNTTCKGCKDKGENIREVKDVYGN